MLRRPERTRGWLECWSIHHYRGRSYRLLLLVRVLRNLSNLFSDARSKSGNNICHVARFGEWSVKEVSEKDWIILPSELNVAITEAKETRTEVFPSTVKNIGLICLNDTNC